MITDPRVDYQIKGMLEGAKLGRDGYWVDVDYPLLKILADYLESERGLTAWRRAVLWVVEGGHSPFFRKDKNSGKETFWWWFVDHQETHDYRNVLPEWMKGEGKRWGSVEVDETFPGVMVKLMLRWEKYEKGLDGGGGEG